MRGPPRLAGPGLGRYRLRSLCDMLGHSFAHHDALEDAKAAARVLLAAGEATGLDLDGWLARVRRPVKLPSARGGGLARGGSPDGPCREAPPSRGH